MTDLPINTSAVPVKSAASSRPSANSEASPQEMQDFGNVLARQVADKSGPADSAPRSYSDTPKQAAGTDSEETGLIEDSANTVPADMLAALLAQQNQGAPSQPEVLVQSNGKLAQSNSLAQPTVPSDAQAIPAFAAQPDAQAMPAFPLQPDAHPQLRMDAASGTGPTAAPGKAALTLLSGKANSANATIPEADMALPQSGNPLLDGKGLANTFKAAVTKETISAQGSPLPRGASVISELANPMQHPGVIPSAGAAASTSPASIGTAVTQPAWGEEFSQKITWMAAQGNQTAELHLNPPQLGPLDVVLKMNGDQASAMFTSPHAAVREAIEQAMPKLREMLADSGIMLGNAMVSDQPARNDQENSSRKAQGRTPASASSGTIEATDPKETRISTLSRHNGMVDTFA